jgi:hypothetical protein
MNTGGQAKHVTHRLLGGNEAERPSHIATLGLTSRRTGLIMVRVGAGVIVGVLLAFPADFPRADRVHGDCAAAEQG